jgi:glycerophosphoryl diester phosphodiesterase
MGALNTIVMKTVDRIYGSIPQLPPAIKNLTGAKIIAHRGVHETPGVLENSWEAFDLALKHKLWGMEFDVRWTRDEVPVILHDPDPNRVFPEWKNRLNRLVKEVTYEELHAAWPEMPRLEDLLRRYGKKLHLMIEVKEPLDTPVKKNRMRALLSDLAPIEDFHIMSLNPRLFDDYEFLPPECFLPVAEWNIKELSRLAMEQRWAGVTGHYLMLNDKILKTHKGRRQKCGTGFINSENLLFRELNRGMEWIFTDKALTVKALLHKALHS